MQADFQILASSDDTSGVSVHTGFPNPAADVIGRNRALALDFNQLLIKHPSSTYLFRVSGEQWAAQGIFDGDIAIIDRSLSAHRGDLVIVWQHDDFLLRDFVRLSSRHRPWGIVTAIIHQYNNK